jgi:hypothetical protein
MPPHTSRPPLPPLPLPLHPQRVRCQLFLRRFPRRAPSRPCITVSQIPPSPSGTGKRQQQERPAALSIEPQRSLAALRRRNLSNSRRSSALPAAKPPVLMSSADESFTTANLSNNSILQSDFHYSSTNLIPVSVAPPFPPPPQPPPPSLSLSLGVWKTGPRICWVQWGMTLGLKAWTLSKLKYRWGPGNINAKWQEGEGSVKRSLTSLWKG